MTEIGTRVLAIRDGGDGVLNVFGEGVYIGDLPLPGSEDIGEEDYTAIKEMIEADDKVPLEQNRAVVFVRATAESVGRDPAVEVQRVIDNITADRALPIAERVREIWNMTRKNPCIRLDNGYVVWGYQCWWGPVEKANIKYDGWTINQVPVPEGNARWQEQGADA